MDIPTTILVAKGALTAFTVLKIWYKVYSNGRTVYKVIKLIKRKPPKSPKVILLTQGVDNDFVLIDT